GALVRERPRDRGAALRLAAVDAGTRAGDEADLPELLEALPDLREERAGRDRRDDGVRQLPAELLGDLEGEGLGALGVVGAQVDVDEAPVELARQLDDQPRAVVVAAAHGVHLAAVDGGREELLGLDRARVEYDGAHAARRRARSDRVAEVARRGATERVRAELSRLRC